ncbi:MAG: hypothetical protein HZB23_09755 [Deltaproteobacteria bacterium]|nr:hypothetical protein [Deltaproteobacteria bacterium]
MLKNKTVWQGLMAGSLVVWAFIIFGLVFPFSAPALKNAWVILFLIWGIAHPLELKFSLPIGKAHGLGFGRTVVKTLLFGFTWWVALKWGVVED